MSKAYKRGRDFEYRVKRRLEGCGFFVIRSAGSHSPVDLVAVRVCDGGCEVAKEIRCEVRGGVCVLGVQCKRGGEVTRFEEERLREVAKFGMKGVIATPKGLRGV